MSGVVWEKEAEQALEGVPFFIRPLVRRKLEERARSQGTGRVTLRDFRETEARFRSATAGKSDDELQRMMPKENAPGVEMVLVEECHNALINCPNVLIDTAAWKRAIEDWARERDISERLRRRVAEEKVLHHHKLRISISGCPNACSRPQIADVGLIGFARPAVTPEQCTSCASCKAACPDAAIAVSDGPPVFDRAVCQGCVRCRNACPFTCISLSRPGMRVLLGGKLGRRPRLAQQVAKEQEPAAVIALLDRVIGDYLARAHPEERFADFLARRD